MALSTPEEIMENTKSIPTNKDEAVLAQPKPNHTAKITSQVLARIGKPPRLHRVEVSNHHNGKYRVNIWEQVEPDKTMAIAAGLRVGPSYYLTVSDTGEIIDSKPPLAKLASCA
jgi:hypothetical protein